MRQHSRARDCGSHHVGCKGGPAHRLAIHTLGGWQISVTPQCVNTFGAQRSARLSLLHHQRLCTQLCPCGRRTWSDIVVLTLGTQLLPQHVVHNINHVFPSCPGFGSAPRAQAASGHSWRQLSICWLNASVSQASTAL